MCKKSLRSVLLTLNYLVICKDKKQVSSARSILNQKIKTLLNRNLNIN